MSIEVRKPLGLLGRYNSTKVVPENAVPKKSVVTPLLSPNKLPNRTLMRIGSLVSEKKFPDSDKAFLHYVKQALAEMSTVHSTEERPLHSEEKKSIPPLEKHSPQEIFPQTISKLKDALNNSFVLGIAGMAMKRLDSRYHNPDSLQGKLSTEERDEIGDVMGRLPELGMAVETFLKAVQNFERNPDIIANLPKDYIDFWYTLRGLVSYHILKGVLPRIQEDTIEISTALLKQNVLQRGEENQVVESSSDQTVFSSALIGKTGMPLLPASIEDIHGQKRVSDELEMHESGEKNASVVGMQNGNTDAKIPEWMEQLGFT